MDARYWRCLNDTMWSQVPAVRGISLVADNPEQIEGRVNGTQIIILTKYVKKAKYILICPG